MNKILFIVFLLISTSILGQKVSLIKTEETKLPNDNQSIIHFNFLKGFENKKNMLLIDQNDTIKVKLDSLDNFSYLYTTNTNKLNLRLIVPVYGKLKISNINFRGQKIYYYNIDYENATIPLPEMRYELGKPVIYLFSDSLMDVEVQLKFNGTLQFSYPKLINQKWKCTVFKDTIYVNDRAYSYLFWEGLSPIDQNHVVKGMGYNVNTDTITSFFENQLDKINFSNNEKDDFITYWGPKMVQYKYVNIQFWTEKYESYAQLEIKPQPDQILRFFMVWSKGEKLKTKPKPQNIPPFKRKGFHVLEWGGSEVDQKFFENENM